MGTTTLFGEDRFTLGAETPFDESWCHDRRVACYDPNVEVLLKVLK